MVQTDPKSSRSLDQNEYLQTGINVNTNIHLTALGCALGRMHSQHLEQCRLGAFVSMHCHCSSEQYMLAKAL
jgi:hypothetical protein